LRLPIIGYAESADALSVAAKFAALPIPSGVTVQGKSDLQTRQKFIEQNLKA